MYVLLGEIRGSWNISTFPLTWFLRNAVVSGNQNVRKSGNRHVVWMPKFKSWRASNIHCMSVFFVLEKDLLCSDYEIALKKRVKFLFWVLTPVVNKQLLNLNAHPEGCMQQLILWLPISWHVHQPFSSLGCIYNFY